MNKTPAESVAFVKELLKNLRGYEDRNILICPPATSLMPVSEVVKNTNISIGAQNMYFEDEGAYTGEISAEMLRSIGVTYVLCGHSERRHVFGETNDVINKKVLKAIEYKLIPVLCIGEKLEERENGKTFEILEHQLVKGLSGITDISGVVIAYEPVWAIGTGKNATPAQAEEVHCFIRQYLEKNYSEEDAGKLSILYGGSVKPENIDLIMKEKNIDGVLVGGASLKTESFIRLIEFKV